MLNNAWPSPPHALSPTQFPLSLHLFLFCSPSAHHSTQQINCREKLRLAKRGGGSRASGTKKKKIKDGERQQMSHLSSCEWSYYFKY